MKNYKLLLASLFVLVTLFSSAQTLNFRMANPTIVNYGVAGDYFKFDVQIMASVSNTYMWVGQAKLSFNPAVLSSTVTDWTVTANNALIGGNYTNPSVPFDQLPRFLTPMVKSINGATFIVGWTPSPATSPLAPSVNYHNLVPVAWTTVVTVLVKITGSTSDVTGNSFIHAGMDGQQQYHSGINTNSNYIVAYSDEFTNLYVGRIFANSAWTQVGGTLNWASSEGTSVWDGAATIPTTGVSLASNLRIHNTATLTVPATGQLTVAGNTDINTASGLSIISDATNTGSFITATTSGAGTASVQRYMAAASWRIATSPVANQGIATFLTSNANIAASTGGNPNLRGMTDYLIGSDTWSPSYNQTTVTGDLLPGKGYMLRAKTGGAGPVNFIGTLNASTTYYALETAGNAWNCVGNPFTSAITKTTFINNNLSLFVPSYEALYVYNGTSYDILNLGQGQATVQAGQGFFVKALSATSLAFSASLKVHDNGAVLKSGNLESEIKLIVRNDNKAASTLIKFIAGTTKGLDRGYDAGIFKSTLGLDLYTRLVEDNGIDFGLQCLPDNDLTTMIIPIGIDSKAGGEVEFSAELMNLPSDCKVILEDKVKMTFTDLTEDDYTTSVEAGSSIANRFQLHTSYQTTGLDGSNLAGKLSAYAVRNTEIRVKGQISNQAVATLYDVQGRVIVVKNLEEGSMNMIPTPNIKTGIYMLYVKENGRMQAFKIPVKE